MIFAMRSGLMDDALLKANEGVISLSEVRALGGLGFYTPPRDPKQIAP